MKIAAISMGVAVCVISANILFATEKLELGLVVLPTCSQCWHVENTIKILEDQYGPALTVELYFLVEENEKGVFHSRLGEADFAELKRQAYLRERHPDKLWKYIQARNTEIYSPIWQHAAQWAGIDSREMAEFSGTTPSAEYWARDADLIKRYNLQKAPAIIINNKVVFEGEAGLPQIERAIQGRIQGRKADYTFDIVHDPKTEQPALRYVRSYLRKYIPGVQLNEVALNAKWEKQLGRAEVKTLPAVIASKDFLDSFYQEYFNRADCTRLNDGKYLLLLPVPGDTLLGKKPQLGTILVIMQSHCAFAGDLLRQLVAKKKTGKLSEDLLFPLFMIEPEESGKNSDKIGFISLHGIGEIEEDARQLIIQKYFPEKYWGYVEEFYTQPGLAWADSAAKAGIDKETVNRLAKQEGQNLLRKNYSAVKDIPLTQSPTLLVDGKYIVVDVNRYFEPDQVKIKGACK